MEATKQFDADGICIVRNIHTGIYRVCILNKCYKGEDREPITDGEGHEYVKFKSLKMTQGYRSLPNCLQKLEELLKEMRVPSECVWSRPVNWDGSEVFTTIRAV